MHFQAYFGLNVCFKTCFYMTAKGIDAPQGRTQDRMPPLVPPLLRHFLQNLLQYFILAYVFSV